MAATQEASGPFEAFTFDVDCGVGHAFEVWTSKIDAWWPANHTYSGESDARVFLERHIGG
jgi:hypothetical protein